MKKTTALAAVAAVAVLVSTPFLVSADDDYWENEGHESRREGMAVKADLKEYSTDEMRIMAYGQALRRFGPGVKVSVDETSNGTYRVELRDADQNLLREQEFDRYGAPVRGSQEN